MCVIAAGTLAFAIYVWRSFPAAHANAILRDVTNLTERVVSSHIPEQEYGEAVFAGEYIQRYYPVGVVLKADHPFAHEYRAKREEQVQRIVDALSEATGVNCGTNWNEWRERLDIPPRD